MRRTRYPKLMEMIALFRKRHPELVSHVAPTDEGFIGYKGRRLLSILNKEKLERVLAYMLDENEFLGPLRHPLAVAISPGSSVRVPGWSARNTRSSTCPAESNTGMFGGNSNWRGPVWMPVNALSDPGAAEPVQLLRRRLQGRVPDRLGAVHDAVRGGPGDFAPAGEHLPARRRADAAAAGLRRRPRSSRTIRTGAI